VRAFSFISFLVFVLLTLNACSTAQVGAEQTPTPDQGAEVTLAALATGNSRLAAQAAVQATPTITPLGTWITTGVPPTGTSQSKSVPNDTPQIISFAASPSLADPTGMITLSWNVRGASSVTVQWADKNMDDVIHSSLPLFGSLSVALSGVKFSGGDQVQFFVSANDANGQLMFDEKGQAIAKTLSVPLKTDMTITSFTASPDPVERGGTVTLTWNASNATSVGITRLSPEGIFLASEALNLPANGSIALPVPEEYVTSITYYLGARDANGVTRGAYLTIGVICRYEDHIAIKCPLTHDYVWAAYEPFEGGHMVWRSDTRQIYVLYDDATYETYEDTWNEGDPIGIEGTPPPGLSSPVRGFGKLWASQPGVREKLGWAAAAEDGYTMLIETVRENFGRYPCTGIYLRLPDNRVVHLYGFSSSWEISPLHFDISPAEIRPGDPVTLTWNVQAERAFIYELDGDGRLKAPAFTVPLSGTLVITTNPTLRNRGDFLLFACSGDQDSCDQAQVSVRISCPDEWFFPEPPAGCPGSPHYTTVVAQHFEHGLMLWLEAAGEIHVFSEIVILYSDDEFSPRWQMVIDDWSPSMPEEDPNIVPPPGYYEPVRGFGKVWRQVPRVRERLGWATGEEFVMGNGAFQCGSTRYGRCYLTGPDNAIYVLEPEMSGWFIWPGPPPTPVPSTLVPPASTPELPVVLSFRAEPIEIMMLEPPTYVPPTVRSSGWR
jgi:hypothetical protein